MPTTIPFSSPDAYEEISPVIAHRGASAHAPENTRAAIELAARQGAQWVEVDVTISSDGIAVIHHDADLKRCSDGDGLVIQKRLAELKQLDVGRWYSDQFRGEQILTLSELLALASHLELGLNLEIKPTIGREPETVWAIHKALQQVHFEQPLLLSSFSIHALQSARRHMPHITRALNVEAIPADWQHRLEEADCAGLHFAKEFFDATQVRAIRDAGYHMLVFTVNDADTAQRLLQAGVDGVFTDMPQQLQQILKGARAGSFNH